MPKLEIRENRKITKITAPYDVNIVKIMVGGNAEYEVSLRCQDIETEILPPKVGDTISGDALNNMVSTMPTGTVILEEGSRTAMVLVKYDPYLDNMDSERGWYDPAQDSHSYSLNNVEHKILHVPSEDADDDDDDDDHGQCSVCGDYDCGNY